MEPSRDTYRRRRRQMLALARDLNVHFGIEDQSVIVYAYGNGWTIRRVEHLWDQQREGALLKNCLRDIIHTDENCWSLRDPDNLPHLAFSCWRIDADDDLSEVPLTIAKMHFLRGSHLFLLVDTPHGYMKDARRAQLTEFADSDAEVDVPWFPSSTRERLMVIAHAQHMNVRGIL